MKPIRMWLCRELTDSSMVLKLPPTLFDLYVLVKSNLQLLRDPSGWKAIPFREKNQSF